MQLTKIPKALTARNQWVNWKMVQSAGELPRRLPLTHFGKAASSTNPATWTDFETVCGIVQKFSGIGYVFSPDDPFCGVDFDGCRDPQTGKIAEWARDWIRKLDSYAEVSPSKTGVKVWVQAKWCLATGKKKALQVERIVADKEPAIEIYDQGRYFAVTGDRIAGLPVEPEARQGVIDELYAAYFSEEARNEGCQESSSSLGVIERARRYIETIPGAISGQSGHNKTFHVACILLLDFALTPTEALLLLSEYNRRCEPPWNEKELRHKIQSADKQPGPRGRLRDAREADWSKIDIPEYRESRKEPPKNTPTIVTLQESAEGYLEKISTSPTSLLSTGIPQVDYAIGGGVERDEMVIIAARPSHGKSAFGLQALDAAAYCEIPCAIVSEEMSALALGKRTVQFVTEVREPRPYVLSLWGPRPPGRPRCAGVGSRHSAVCDDFWTITRNCTSPSSPLHVK